MSKEPASRTAHITSACLEGHPSFRAWTMLHPSSPMPERIELLKKRRKTCVYKLVGLGSGGQSVIANLCPTAKARAERVAYEEVLPRLAVGCLRYYGVVEDSDPSFRWVFTEDAGGVRYSPDIPEHRVIVAEWLGKMHVAGMRAAADLGLPDRGPCYFHDLLHIGRDQLSTSLGNPFLTDEDRAVLKELVGFCDALSGKWDRIEDSCAGLPHTFVHGDLHPSNVRIQESEDGLALLPFDWENAGWGVPVTDLKLPRLDLGTYLSAVQQRLPGVTLAGLERLNRIGELLGLLLCIYRDSKLNTKWVKHQVRNARYYAARLPAALDALGLQP